MVLKPVIAALFCLVLTSNAQSPTAPRVNPDRTITFRYADAGAGKVEVVLEGTSKALPLVRGADGVWTATTPPLQPEIYGYTLRVDGLGRLDPLNPDIKPNFLYLSNTVTVPGATPMPWELSAVPHGRLDLHRYTTHVAKNLPGSQSAYIVYTPPGYDEKRKAGYPVLYLLHGYSDGEDGWTAVGHAQFMLDAMIAEDKAVPMIVVMPLGYGDFDFIKRGQPTWDDPAMVAANVTLFSQALETEVMPSVEREYNAARGRESRAIAGLSMGGLESLYIGLSHAEQFAWVVGLSAAITPERLSQRLTDLDARKANLRLLWVACGTDDHLITVNREFVTWAKDKGLPVTPIETPGAHTWLVWRDNLLHFAPLLFRPK